MTSTSKLRASTTCRRPDGVVVYPNGFSNVAMSVYGFEAGLLAKLISADCMVSIPAIIKKTTLTDVAVAKLVDQLCSLGILKVSVKAANTPTIYTVAKSITILDDNINLKKRKRLVLKKFDAEESPIHKLYEWIIGTDTCRICDSTQELPQSSRRLCAL